MQVSRYWPRVLFTGNPELAREGRCEPDPDLPGLSLGERIQRKVQWNAPPRGSQIRMVHNDQAGTDRDQLLAQAIQTHTTASGPQHAPTNPRNSSPKWHRTWGLDKAKTSPPVLSSGNKKKTVKETFNKLNKYKPTLLQAAATSPIRSTKMLTYHFRDRRRHSCEADLRKL